MNEYTTMLLEQPLELFKKYSVSPPDGVSQVDRANQFVTGRAYSDPQEVSDKPLFSGFKWGQVKGDRAVGWIELSKAEVGKHQAPAGSLIFNVFPDKNTDSIPIYFLPWESKSLIKMTIPKKDEKRNSPDEPRIFFTAAINGCSVFVRGNPKEPEVFHAGISQGSTPYANDPARYWRELLGEHMSRSGISGRVQEVNNTDYINQTGVSGGARTANADTLQNWIKMLPRNSMQVTEVTPWGCVFGIRYGALWSFYLQENAKVTTYRIEKHTRPTTITRQVKRNAFVRKVTGTDFKIVTTIGEEEFEVKAVVRSESFPMIVRSFYPGEGKVVIKSSEFRAIGG